MMREIKFRYYWKHDGTNEVRFKEYNLDDIQHGEVQGPDFTIRWDQIAEAQYTGLKDKNGNEIYEGDIIRSRNFYFEVRWINAAFHLVNRTEFRYGPRHYSMTQKQVKGMEIISNIYQERALVSSSEIPTEK